MPNTENEDPKRPRDRRLRADPMCTKSKTDIPLPTRWKLRSEIADPRCTKSRIDSDDPKRAWPKIAIDDPKRVKLRRLKELARFTKSSTLSEEPSRVTP
jgi:hypothetical protein